MTTPATPGTAVPVPAMRTALDIGRDINEELRAWYRRTGGHGEWFELSQRIAAAIEAERAEVARLTAARDQAVKALEETRAVLAELLAQARTHYDDDRCSLYDGGLANAMDAAIAIASPVKMEGP